MTTQTERRVPGGARSIRSWLLLIAGLAITVVVAVLALAMLGEPDPGAPAGPGVGPGASDASAPSIPNVPAGVEAGDVDLGDDPVGNGAELACSRFREGDTVIEFAAWFEVEVDLAVEAERELFQAIIARALTESCPEVVPGG